MMNPIIHNSKNHNDYRYYHICIIDKIEELEKLYDLSFDEAKNKINDIKDPYTFKVIGTIESINLCVDFINRNNINDGILGGYITKNDIFKSNNSLFVNCTDYFKKLYKN